jgi:hypothetical protein
MDDADDLQLDNPRFLLRTILDLQRRCIHLTKITLNSINRDGGNHDILSDRAAVNDFIDLATLNINNPEVILESLSFLKSFLLKESNFQSKSLKLCKTFFG